VLAQIAATDMRMPSSTPLTYPERAEAPVPKIDWNQAGDGSLSARHAEISLAASWRMRPGDRRFGRLHVERRRTKSPVEAFLQEKIGFLEFTKWSASVFRKCPSGGPVGGGSAGDRRGVARRGAELTVQCRQCRLRNTMVAIAENILWAAGADRVMIMIHEFGHFWAARYFDVKVEAFSLGFGPRYSVSAAAKPITGSSRHSDRGYVKMAVTRRCFEQVRADSPAALALPKAAPPIRAACLPTALAARHHRGGRAPSLNWFWPSRS